jgi:integrase
VLYALRFLGPRPGEAANARWQDLNRTKKPLWRLTLESSFKSPARREKGTKTGAELNIPVHPVLQRILEDWEDHGWEAFMGRKPKPGDFIVPRDDGTQRLVSTSYKQFKVDLAAIGLDFQRPYESRATFRNLALSGGAPKYQVDLITHPKPTGTGLLQPARHAVEGAVRGGRRHRSGGLERHPGFTRGPRRDRGYT